MRVGQLLVFVDVRGKIKDILCYDKQPVTDVVLLSFLEQVQKKSVLQVKKL